MPGPPLPNELELTLIGPNVGESVIAHYQGNWFLFDSCTDRKTGEPAAHVYLTSIGVQPEQVRVIACTHWHDDHFRGLGRLSEVYSHAQLWMSHALRREEFIDVVEAWRNFPSGAYPHTSGLEELTKCVDIARERNRPPMFASHDKRMWLSEDGTGELWSLSPSAAMIVKSQQDIAALFPATWSIKKAAAESRPNHIAVAMHLRAGNHSIILGSDLEEEGDPQTGWSAVIASTAKPPQRGSLYKVAHHGSETGHHGGIWTSLLSARPVAVLSPFSRSHLPRDSDVTRLKGLSSAVYITAKRGKTEVKRTGAVGKFTQQKKLRVIAGLAGAVTCRIDASNPAAEWSIQLEGLAEKL
ncbi:MBL fold metallo-hydrolase [Ramlibacter henchirensis]|uniref:MBL fold metallo-hydrolase n=1 Tax=Ramlibacter henchirensis TaxID=204072 RepID=A0A4Z0BRN4_9BURK|nr:MBL fold metallo-hydrolase [Ramlibacter henchirensis]TFZ00675.1 MBL fold metallo-hydrolase [Ramlibacter henchirensis]